MEQRATERDLVARLREADKKFDILTDELDKASMEYDKAEAALIELLEANGADATAHYDGLGTAKLSKPKLYANYKKENEVKVFDFLKKQGRRDLIKTNVNDKSLSTFVAKELIGLGKEVPEFIGYWLKQSIKLCE
jgi:hypothetical protein